MKHNIFALATLLTTTLALSNVAYADQTDVLDAQRRAASPDVASTNQGADAQAIRNLYQSKIKATVNIGNPSALDQQFENYAPNYIGTMLDGRVTNLQQERQYWVNFRSAGVHRNASISLNYKQIKSDGQRATVVYTELIHLHVYTYYGASTQLYDVHTAKAFLVEDTWKNTNNGWKIASSRNLQEHSVQEKPVAVPLGADAINQANTVNKRWDMLNGLGVPGVRSGP